MSSKQSVTLSGVDKIENKWSVEDTNELLSRMMRNLSKPDTLKYTSMLEKLSWDKIAFGNFSVDDCKRKWNVLFRKVRKYRTLGDLITDAQEYVRDPYKGQAKKHPDYPKRPLTPYFQFFIEQRDSFAAQHKHMNNLEVTAELSKKYKELPVDIKNKYVVRWQKKTKQFQIAMQKFKAEHPEYFVTGPVKPHEPRTPVIIYKDENLDQFARKHPKLSKKECTELLRKQYKVLSDAEKQKYIDKSLKDQQEYKVAMTEYCKTNPPQNSSSQNKMEKSLLSKYERKLNDKSIGKPEKPPSNGYNLFCTETMPKLTTMAGQQRIVECGKLWMKKSEEEKKQYQKRYLKMKEDYEENYKKFCESLSPEERKKEEQLMKSKRKSLGSTSGGKAKSEKKEVSSEDSSDDVDEIDADDTTDDESEDSDDDDDDDSDDEEQEKRHPGVYDDPETEKFQQLAPARPTTPISALFLYQKAHRKKVESQYPGISSDEITRLLARRYHELPQHKRHKYVLKEKEQRALYNERMQQYLKEGAIKNGVSEKPVDVPPQPQPVTGEQVYHEKFMASYMKKYDNDKEQVEKALRTAWSKMNKARREPFILSAQKLNEENIAAYREAVQSAAHTHATTNSNLGVARNAATKSNGKKVKLDGEPTKPPSNGYQLFSATHLSSLSHLAQNERFKEIGRMWQELDAAKKKTYTDEAKKKNDKYKNELAAWLKKLPQDVAQRYVSEHSKKRTKRTDSSQPAKKAKIDEGPEIKEANAESDEDSSDSGEESDSSSSDESNDDDSSSDSSDSDDSDDEDGESSSSDSSDDDSTSSQSD